MAVTLSVEGTIAQATTLSERLQLLLSNDRQHVNKTERDALCLLHWSIIFEHHQGMLLLLRNAYCAPVFALLRPFEEAFLRSFVAMHGTEKEAAALWDGTYRTKFEVVGKQIDQRLGLENRFGPMFKGKIKALHGFTHGGKEQLVRQARGSDIVSSFSDDEVRAVVDEAMPIVFLAVLFITDFLGYPAEHRSALALLDEYARPQSSSQ